MLAISAEKHTIVSASALTPASLVPHLRRCQYGDALLARDYDFGRGRVPVAAFADTPHDARSVCIAVVDASGDPGAAVVAARPLGAPVVFTCQGRTVQWWKQTAHAPVFRESIENAHLGGFFRQHRGDFSPANIFKGKTLRRLPGRRQLDFVDAGLMPFVERTEGERLSRLVEKCFGDIEDTLDQKLGSEADAQKAIKATFWLLAAKALRDKAVSGFKTVDLTNIEDLFVRVGKHYGVPNDVPPRGKPWREATARAAERIGGFETLRNLSTESLAHVYENALVTPEVRKANGTHCTPGPLVDYIIWQLWPWIEALPVNSRHVFEPACGHAAFLVGALRVLRQWSGIGDGKARHAYLRRHLHGIEYDPFAIEVARLSLTLAEVPYGNRWDLGKADMFTGRALEAGARRCGVLLANPPYEAFTKREQVEYAEAGVRLGAKTKACEMLRRTIPHLTDGACFGVVVPQGFLHSREGTAVRRTILAEFELSEIDVFEDNLFEKGEHEIAVLLGRRRTRNRASHRLWFRRVRNVTVEAFRDRFAFSSEESVDISRFVRSESVDLRVPELDAVWRYLSAFPALKDIAAVGKGLDHKGKTLPSRCWTVHDPARPGDPLGYANVHRDLNIFGTPRVVGINLKPRAVLSYRSGRTYGKPQVLYNYARVSREAWRLKASLDERGLALTSRLVAVRPNSPRTPVLFLWALLNSPVANAFAHCQTFKRDILVGTMRRMPVPRSSPAHMAHIEQAAMRYRALATSTGPLYDAEATQEGTHRALLEMDAAVLRAYDLPPRLERQLLDLFTGVPRKGVGCDFTGYYPAGFSSCLPLHLLLSERFERAAADVTSDRFKPGQSAHVREVLAAARADTDGD